MSAIEHQAIADKPNQAQPIIADLPDLPTHPAAINCTNDEGKAPDVTVCDGESRFLLGRKKMVSDPAKTPANSEEKISPGEYLPNDRHDRHHRHTLTDDVLSAATDPGDEDLAHAVALIEDVIKRCGDEPALLASDEFGAAAKLIREQDQGEWFRLRVALKKAKPSGVLLSDIDKATQPESEGGEDSTTADDLVALVQGKATLFHSEAGDCFAVLNDTPRQVFKLDTQAFSEWLGYAYYRATESEKGPGRAASDAAIKTARMVLAGIAKNDGDECPVYLRAARQSEAYFIDLGDDDWRVVEVNASGWRIWNGSPVSFWRASTTRPLVLAWMLESWRPETPFPILELIGQQGTAKSSTQDRIRDCIDPNAVNLRAAPKSVEDLFVSAGCNWLASLNNLSHLSANIQDAICNLATGGGFAGRTLYTNADETLIEAKRPVVINGIVPLVTAQDLTDRVIHIELPEIGGYRSETEIKAAFEKDAPQIVGGLLDLLVQTLATLPRVHLPRPPRMADFALLGEAMLQSQGHPPGLFVALYGANRRQSVARSLDASPVAVAVREMAEAYRGPDGAACFTGNFQELLSRLETYRRDTEAWPKSHRGLSDVLRRQRPALAQIGILIDIGPHTRKGVTVTIKRKCDDGDGCDGRLKDILWEKSFSGSSVYATGKVEGEV